jgi:hypothetical protein
VTVEAPPEAEDYLNAFASAWSGYSEVAHEEALSERLRKATLILVGDYHALPQSQLYAAELLAQLKRLSPERQPPVLGLECFYSGQQRWLDRWWQGELDFRQLMLRTSFDQQWGYDPEPYRHLLAEARRNCAGVFGLDLCPRSGFRRLAERDRHFASEIAALRSRFAGAQIVALIGESHLAPRHLPRLLQLRLARESCLLIFQNLDSIYAQVVRRHREPRPVWLSENAYCVFTAHPAEKYECFRRYLETVAA